MKHHTSKKIIIQKASGEMEPFDTSKLRISLKNAGADDDVITSVSNDIQAWVYEGVTTRRIYERAFQLLRSRKQSGALRYRLKDALFSLGPTGYPFEHFIGELFKWMGYEVQVGQVVEGVTITHEIDVIATKGNVQHLIECKYTHDQGNRLNVQVPLYVHSRVEDIVEKRRRESRYSDFTFSAWVVTNARFSSDSEAYSRSKKIQLLGWDYPGGKGLKDLIGRSGIFPVTILKSLHKKEAQQLMEEGIVTCDGLMANTDLLIRLQIDSRKQRAVLRELEEIAGKA